MFRDSYVINMCVMNILCLFHISVLWVCYIVSYLGHSLEGALRLCIDAVGEFYNPSWLGMFVFRVIKIIYRTLAWWLECSPKALRPGCHLRSSHTKDSKMVLDASLLNNHHFKVGIKGKVKQTRERSSALLYTSV